MTTLKPLSKQVILITGASSGIGLITARMAAERGAKVFLVARNGAVLAKIVKGIQASGGIAGFAVADVADEIALGRAAREAITQFGRIDTWMNNAGVAIYAPLLETPSDEHERLFQTNYFGVVNGSRIAVLHLRENGGALITTSSIAADIPSPILGAYSASKHAVKAYLESLRIELQAAQVPVVVTIVKPSGMATPIGQHAANHMPGEAMIPPPAYDPHLTAETLLFCAQNVRREVTVGGIGRAQVLFGTHFPALFDRLAAFVVPLLVDPSRAKTPGDALDTPGRDGTGQLVKETLLDHSLYNSALRHRVVTTVSAAGVVAGIALLLRHRRKPG